MLADYRFGQSDLARRMNWRMGDSSSSSHFDVREFDVWLLSAVDRLVGGSLIITVPQISIHRSIYLYFRLLLAGRYRLMVDGCWLMAAEKRKLWNLLIVSHFISILYNQSFSEITYFRTYWEFEANTLNASWSMGLANVPPTCRCREEKRNGMVIQMRMEWKRC